jgi:hypothetical protein
MFAGAGRFNYVRFDFGLRASLECIWAVSDGTIEVIREVELFGIVRRHLRRIVCDGM